jgi:hypothetical protein
MSKEDTEENEENKEIPKKKKKIEITNGTYILFPPKVRDGIHLNKISIKKKDLIGRIVGKKGRETKSLDCG